MKKSSSPNNSSIFVANFWLKLINLCQHVLFVDTRVKVKLYILLVFFGSILIDVFVSVPKSYFSRKNNLFNVYFVKLSWGWTLAFVGAFVTSSSVLMSSLKGKIIRKQTIVRLITATVFWLFFTKSFVFIEESFGYCSRGAIFERRQCLNEGFAWRGSFSISGHCFILIFCTLIIMEEANTVKQVLRITHQQSNGKFALFIHLIFLGIVVLSIIWDIMLMATILYFHSTLEKCAGASIAIGLWWLIYRWEMKKYFRKSLPLLW